MCRGETGSGLSHLLQGPDLVGLQIVRFPLRQRFVDVGAELGLVEMVGQRALFLGMEKVFNNLLLGEFQVDAVGAGVDERHGIAETGGAAAGRDDRVLHLQDLLQRGILQLPKRRLPVPLEQQGNRRVVFLLDVEVEVDEVHAEPPGKTFAEGALAGTGKADEDDGHFGLRFTVEGVRGLHGYTVTWLGVKGLKG